MDKILNCLTNPSLFLERQAEGCVAVRGKDVEKASKSEPSSTISVSHLCFPLVERKAREGIENDYNCSKLITFSNNRDFELQ